MTAADPFAGMSDAAVLERAADHLQKAAAHRHGSAPSKREWESFQVAMAALDRRQAAARWRAAMRLMPLNVAWRDRPAGSPPETGGGTT
jgi:hypothetical protein